MVFEICKNDQILRFIIYEFLKKVSGGSCLAKILCALCHHCIYELKSQLQQKGYWNSCQTHSMSHMAQSLCHYKCIKLPIQQPVPRVSTGTGEIGALNCGAGGRGGASRPLSTQGYILCNILCNIVQSFVPIVEYIVLHEHIHLGSDIAPCKQTLLTYVTRYIYG